MEKWRISLSAVECEKWCGVGEGEGSPLWLEVTCKFSEWVISF